MASKAGEVEGVVVGDGEKAKQEGGGRHSHRSHRSHRSRHRSHHRKSRHSSSRRHREEGGDGHSVNHLSEAGSLGNYSLHRRHRKSTAMVPVGVMGGGVTAEAVARAALHHADKDESWRKADPPLTPGSQGRRSRRHRHRHSHRRGHHGHGGRPSPRADLQLHALKKQQLQQQQQAQGGAQSKGPASGGGVPERDLEQVFQFVSQQIWQRTKKDSDIMRRVALMFGRPNGFVTFPIFKHYLHQSFGVRLSTEQAEELFKRFDKRGVGRVSIAEMVTNSQTPDYSAPLWNVERDKAERAVAQKRLHEGETVTLKALPASLEPHRWSEAKIEKALQTKILERTKRPEVQYLQAYRLFGKPKRGIARAGFKHKLMDLGIMINDTELDALIKKYDPEGTGKVQWREFVKHVMPADYAERSWNDKRFDEIAKAETSKPHRRFEPVLESWPQSLHQKPMSLKEFVELLREKIIGRTRRPEDQFRKAYHVFGNPLNGIPLSVFREKVAALGIVASKEQSQAVFDAIDANNNGIIEFSEFMHHIMGQDMDPDKLWFVARAREEDAENERRKHALERGEGKPILREFPKSLAMAKPSFADLLVLIQEKLISRTKRPSDQYREVFNMFGSPQDGVTKELLRFKLEGMNIALTDAELDQLFDYFDVDKNGSVDFQELVRRLMPRDFTRESYHQRRDREIRAAEEERKKQWIQESPFTVTAAAAKSDPKLALRQHTTISERESSARYSSRRSSSSNKESPERLAARAAANRRRVARERRFPAARLTKLSRDQEAAIVSRHAGVPVVLKERTSRATAAHAASPHGLKPRVQPPRRPVLTSTKKALQHSVSAVSAALGLPVEGGAAGGAAAGMGAGPGAGVPNGSSRGFRGSSSRAGGGGAWTARNAATRRDALRMLGKSRTVGDLLPQQKTALQHAPAFTTNSLARHGALTTSPVVYARS